MCRPFKQVPDAKFTLSGHREQVSWLKVCGTPLTVNSVPLTQTAVASCGLPATRTKLPAPEQASRTPCPVAKDKSPALLMARMVDVVPGLSNRGVGLPTSMLMRSWQASIWLRPKRNLSQSIYEVVQ